jgi:hypothetical protein
MFSLCVLAALFAYIATNFSVVAGQMVKADELGNGKMFLFAVALWTVVILLVAAVVRI